MQPKSPGKVKPNVSGNNSLVCSDIKDYLIDPDHKKDYCNLVLKSKLNEKADYEIISFRIMKELNKIYGCEGVKRYVVSRDNGRGCIVEVWLKTLEILYFPRLDPI